MLIYCHFYSTRDLTTILQIIFQRNVCHLFITENAVSFCDEISGLSPLIGEGNDILAAAIFELAEKHNVSENSSEMKEICGITEEALTVGATLLLFLKYFSFLSSNCHEIMFSYCVRGCCS